MNPEVPVPALLAALERLEAQLGDVKAELAHLRAERDAERDLGQALLPTADAATLMHKSEDWMRGHADQFFASKVGDGPRAEYLFPRWGIEDYLEAHRAGRPAPADAGATSSAAPEDELKRRRSRRTRRKAPAAGPELAATGTSVMSWA
jgi:hypothetical protein